MLGAGVNDNHIVLFMSVIMSENADLVFPNESIFTTHTDSSCLIRHSPKLS